MPVIESEMSNIWGLRPGDCFDYSWKTISRTGVVIPMSPDDPHQCEVFANVVMTSEDWPGTTSDQVIELRFRTQFEQYLGEPWSDSLLDYTFFCPSEAMWKAGVRRLVFYLFDWSGVDDGWLTGSVRAPNA